MDAAYYITLKEFRIQAFSNANTYIATSPPEIPANLFFSIEDIDPETRPYRRLLKKYSPHTLIILRDPVNWLASSIRHNRHSPETLKKHLRILKNHLRISIETSPTSTVTEGATTIDYNRFCTSREYRMSLAHRFNAFHVDKAELALNNTPDFGGGSSFKKDTNRPPSERWKEYWANPFFSETLCDPELYELAHRFCGDIAPVQRLKELAFH